MITRRNALKSLGLSALAIPGIPALSMADNDLPLPDADDPAFWSGVRDQYMLSRDKVFFNPGTVGAMPRVVVDKMTEHLRNMAINVADWAYKDDNKEYYISGYQHLLFIREKAARLIGCDVGELALTDNTTHAMSYIANGLDLWKGDEILTTDQEHSGGKSPWDLRQKRHGMTVRTVRIPKPVKDARQVKEIVLNSITPSTKVLMLSHMITGSGAILPVKEICEEAARRNIFTVLDGAQTVGPIKINLHDVGCDAYVGCFHKWIGAPAGTGFMYVKAGRMKEIWTTVASGRWDNHDDEGFRFIQRGTGNFSVLVGLDAALDFYDKVGPDRIFERIKFLGDRLRTGLRKIGKVKIFSPEEESMCAGITVYKVEGWKGSAMQDTFWEKARMRPRSQGDEFGVRHCTHIFNSPEEIDKAIAIVQSMAAS
jgi:selenocysteine lyase/cysteine desulfurase